MRWVLWSPGGADMLLTVVIALGCIAVIPSACLAVTPRADNVISEILAGNREACMNEGEQVRVESISSCYSCICKNGFVECRQELRCPNTEGCYYLLEKPKNGCCRKCKSCIFNGKEYASDSEWSDPRDPCRVYRCEAGVITDSNLQCYTPCDKPIPPQQGQCCPTCPVCHINGQRVSEGRDVTIPEDPCLKCRCELENIPNFSRASYMTCSKRACPVLTCPEERQRRQPGECCPVCRGTRSLLHVPKSCVFGHRFLKSGSQFSINKCTHCKCDNGTSLCQRPACPVLECLPEHQKTKPGECCPHCPPIEETKNSCTFGGHTYKDGDSWQLDPCKSCMCHQGEPRCAMERCPNQIIPCPLNYRLQKLPGQCCPKCVENDGVCTVFGDPHYKTFDGKFYSFQGSCKYQLTADCVDHTFSIRVTNDARNTKVSAWTKTISIKIKELKINLGQKKRVKVDGTRVNIPYKLKGKVEIERINDTIKVITHIGVVVVWDGNSFLEVSVPSKYKGKLCGLCGNFNYVVPDDLMTRKGRILEDHEVHRFGMSWRVGGKKACARQQEVMPKEKYYCKHNSKWTHRLCKPLTDSNTFGGCDKKLNPNKYYKACIMDMCECPSGKCFCEAFNAYAHECERLGARLPDWRRLTLCDNNSTAAKSLSRIPVLSHSPRPPSFNSFKGPTARQYQKYDRLYDRPQYDRPHNINNRGPPPPLN